MILIRILHGRLSIKCHGWKMEKDVWKHSRLPLSVMMSREKRIKEGGGSGRGRDRGRQNLKCQRVKRAEIGGRTEYRMRRDRKRATE